MATNSTNELDKQRQQYFDQLASKWDSEVTLKSMECLGNIVNELNIHSGSRVLDIGSGTGILLPLLVKAVGDEGRIVALDFSAKMLYQAKAKGFLPPVAFVQADVAALPLPNQFADLALCYSAFPHFGDKPKALKEIARVIKVNGRLVICHTASRNTINQLHKSIGGIVNTDLLPDESQLRELIKHAGFTITCLEDAPDRYLVIAKKVIKTPH